MAVEFMRLFCRACCLAVAGIREVLGSHAEISALPGYPLATTELLRYVIRDICQPCSEGRRCMR